MSLPGYEFDGTDGAYELDCMGEWALEAECRGCLVRNQFYEEDAIAFAIAKMALEQTDERTGVTWKCIPGSVTAMELGDGCWDVQAYFISSVVPADIADRAMSYIA